MPDAKLEATWGFMAPWCRALRHKLLYKPVKYLQQRRHLQVLVPLRDVVEEDSPFYDGSDTFQLVREGLALLAAVATVDYKAWRYLLEEHCAVPLGQEGDELYEDEIPVRFLLILDRSAARRGWNRKPNSFSPEEARAIDEAYAGRSYTEDLLEFCSHESHSGAYVDYLSRVSALLQDNTKLDIQIPVQARFEHGYAEMRALEEMVKAETLLEEEKQKRVNQLAQTELLQCSFVLESTLADCMRGGVEPDVCETLGAIVQGNVFLSSVVLSPYIDEVGDEEFGRFMGLLLNSVRRFSSSRHNDTPYRFGKVELGCLEWMPNRGPEMVLSALAQTRTTNSLGFSLMEDEWEVTGMWWKWIAYAFFSKRSRTCSAVENLALNWIKRMRPSDMEMFAAVVAAENPEEVLFDSPPGVVAAREATLQSGSLVHWQIPTQGDAYPRTLAFVEPVPGLWTFSDDGESDWLNAVIPGYGRCLVQRCDLVFNCSPSVDENTKGVRSLELSFMQFTDRTGMPRFLSAVASTLRILTIDNEFDQFDVSMVLQCCPLLEELVVYDEWVDIRLNFSEFHETCQPLPTLTLDWGNLPATLAPFSDPGSTLARCLRKFRIFLVSNCLNGDHFLGRSSADVGTLLEMLEKNRTLQYLEVITPTRNFHYEDEFRKFHLQPIAVQENPLSMECKTAFLSAFRSESSRRIKKAKGGEEPSPLPSLDTFVASNIFAFAAEPVKRQVYFTKGWCSDLQINRRNL